jgi:hypothetical protein
MKPFSWTSVCAPRALSRPARRGTALRGGLRGLCFPRAAQRPARRPAQRPVFTRRGDLRAGGRRAAVRHPDNLRRLARPALAHRCRRVRFVRISRRGCRRSCCTCSRSKQVGAMQRWRTVAFDLRHPEQVPLTERGTRAQPLGVAGQIARWWRARHESQASSASARLRAQVILVGVHTEHPDDDRLPALQSAARQLVAAATDYRLICVAVIHAAPVGEGNGLEDTASGLH